MATGPWHYSEAERLLYDVLPSTERPDEILAVAQVHATLALAAATAMAEADWMAGDDGVAWSEIAGTK